MGDDTSFLKKTNEEYAAWCKTFYQAEALDQRGMRSLDGLWAWQEQERRFTAAMNVATQELPRREPGWNGPMLADPPKSRETDSTGAMSAAWFATTGAGSAIDQVFGETTDPKTDLSVKPWGYASDSGEAFPASVVETWPYRNKQRMTKRLYDEITLASEIDSAVVKERARIDRMLKTHSGLDLATLEYLETMHQTPTLQVQPTLSSEIGLAVVEERARCLQAMDSLPTPASFKEGQYAEFLAWTAAVRRKIDPHA